MMLKRISHKELLPIISISANSDLIMAGIVERFAILEQPIIPNLIFESNLPQKNVYNLSNYIFY